MDDIKTLTQEKETYLFLAEGLTQGHQQSVKLDLLRKADSIQAKINELECARAKALIENSGLNIDGVVHLLKRAVFKRRNGIGYLTFTPKGMKVPTTLPVITKGNRDKANAWTWNGNLEKPTVRPSVRTKYANEKGEQTEIHYWLNDGICQCLGDCKDGNAGKEIPLKECEG